MSSILKALRKIDEEKRRAGRVAPDLSSDQGFIPRKSRQWLLLLGGILLGAVTVGVLFRVTLPVAVPSAGSLAAPQAADPAAVERQARTAAEEGQPAQGAAAVAANSTTAIPSTAGQGVAVSEETTPVPVVVLPPEPVAIGNASRAQSAPTRAVTTTKSAGQGDPASVVSAPLAPAPLMPVLPPAALPATADLPAGVDLLVSEIFYQDDGGDSMAVVNDLPVMVGSHVDAALVTEILADRVRFKIADSSYTVLLSEP